ncbi:MAG TPA: response regulator [Dongiaceae bacterium]|nr:response regulator [Dongiaceae bacterium]
MKNKPVILVVDDQLHNIKLLEGFLVRLEYEVIQAESGEEALEKLIRNQVDLVLLDVKMPGMSGFEVLAKLRADKKTRRIPVVMITAYNENEARAKAFESGCDDFISKPFDQYELLARVKSLLRIKFLNDEIDEAREFAENIINTVREPLISLDQDLRVVTASRSFYEFFKVKPEETVGQLIYDLGNKQWDIPKLRELLETILPQHTTFDNYEVEHDFATIGRRIMLLNARQIFRENIGSHIILLALEDITERKLAEEDIKSLNVSLAARAADLEDANLELEAFNYTVAHDLRNPLNVISISCQAVKLLCSDKLDEECKNYLQSAYEGTLSMSRLIGALLNFSRLIHVEPHRGKVDLCALAHEVATMLKQTAPERQVDFRIADGIAAIADTNLVRAVLDNLLGNAWKYTGKREEAVVEFGATEIDGKPVYFVRDNGAGFDMADADKLFTPFQRLPGAEEFRGFGIGLATVGRIIRRHGGKIWAEGEPDKGATFYFTLSTDGVST